MAQEWAKSFYNSKKWSRCREGYRQERIMINGGMCEACGKRPGYIVHHKIVLSRDNIDDPEVSLNWENLEYVCKDCHDKFEGHGLNKSAKPLCVFDEHGQPVSIRHIDKDPGKLYERRRE